MFICTQFIDQLPVGLLAQLVERCLSVKLYVSVVSIMVVVKCVDFGLLYGGKFLVNVA